MKTAESKTATTRLLQAKSNTAPFFQPEASRQGFFGAVATPEPFFKPAPPAVNAPKPATVQAKLTVGAPDDVYEQEADAMADKVVQKLASGDNGPAVQRTCAACRQEEEVIAPKLQRRPMFGNKGESAHGQVQRKCAACAAEEIQPMRIQRMEEEEPELQAKSDVPGLQAPADLESRLTATKGSGNALPDDTRTSMEPSFGADFSKVRVHNNSGAVQMSQELGAQAFTHGSDIYFNSGKYDPQSSGGQHLLAHELTHTVQQGGANSLKIQKRPLEELEADYKNAINSGNWGEAAKNLNEYNDDDIRKKIKKLSHDQLIKLKQGAIESMPGFSERVAGFIDKVIGSKWIEKLNKDFQTAVSNGDWEQAAVVLNTYSDDDIYKKIKKLNPQQRESLRNGAVTKMAGWSSQTRITKPIEDLEILEREEARVKNLNADYDNAVNPKAPDWDKAAVLLNGYNDEDIIFRLNKLNREQLSLMRAGAARQHMDKIVQIISHAIQESLKSSGTLGLATAGNQWSLNFVKGLELSGLSGKFGESWVKIKENLSDLKKGTDFLTGFQVGVPVGGLKDLWSNLKGIVEIIKFAVELDLELKTNPKKVVENVSIFINSLPSLLIGLLDAEGLGLKTGVAIGDNIKSDFIDKSPSEQGMYLGEIWGMIGMEVALLFIGVEEVTMLFKGTATGIKSTRLGIEVVNAMEKSKVLKAAFEIKGGRKVLKGAEELAQGAEKVGGKVGELGKMERSLAEMAKLEKEGKLTKEALAEIQTLEHQLLKEKVKEVKNIHPVQDGEMMKIYDAEVTIGDPPNSHEYRHKKGSSNEWCRFSPPPPKWCGPVSGLEDSKLGELSKALGAEANSALSKVGSAVHPHVPPYTGGKTQGIFRHGNVEVPLESGESGPGKWIFDNLEGGPGSGKTRAWTHVEGHAAGIMHKNGLKEAELFINQRPCQYGAAKCEFVLNKLIPKDSKLIVRFLNPDGTVGVGIFESGVSGFKIIE